MASSLSDSVAPRRPTFHVPSVTPPHAAQAQREGEPAGRWRVLEGVCNWDVLPRVPGGTVLGTAPGTLPPPAAALGRPRATAWTGHTVNLFFVQGPPHTRLTPNLTSPGVPAHGSLLCPLPTLLLPLSGRAPHCVASGYRAILLPDSSPVPIDSLQEPRQVGWLLSHRPVARISSAVETASCLRRKSPGVPVRLRCQLRGGKEVWGATGLWSP